MLPTSPPNILLINDLLVYPLEFPAPIRLLIRMARQDGRLRTSGLPQEGTIQTQRSVEDRPLLQKIHHLPY